MRYDFYIILYLCAVKTKDIHISEYNYELPDERIAKFPKAERDHSKLLVYNKGEVGEDIFYNLPNYLPQGALMVYNNTKVIQARLHFRKETGALIEIFLLEPAEPADYEQMFQQTRRCSWLCLVGNQKKWKEGTLSRELRIKDEELRVSATRRGEHGTSQWIDFEWDNERVNFAEILDVMGELPIPPYLNRETQESDKTTYQTVYSKIKGSVAAPTAGLHFTERVLKDVDDRGIEREEVTLHVGAGTFKPVKSEEIGGHDMHTEHIAVSRHTIERLIAHGGRATAVGTTSVRTLESLYWMGRSRKLHVNQWEPYEDANEQMGTIEALERLLRLMDEEGTDVLHATTQIIIAPGYKYRIVERMITNFHQPQSTLLLLVSAFLNQPGMPAPPDEWRRIYRFALDHEFRFLSYGDSSLLIPQQALAQG